MSKFVIEHIKPYKHIAIIGLAKNIGKTTTLNYLIRKCRGKNIALTSIGRDGETACVVTKTDKPKIFIEEGTLVATARGCLKRSDFTPQVLDATGFNTPLGEVILLKALSAGFLDLAGPSSNTQIKKLLEMMAPYDLDHLFIDGAFDRRSIADSYICNGVIIATGATYHRNMEIVVRDTEHLIDVLSFEAVEDDLREWFHELMKQGIFIIDCENQIKKLPIQTALGSIDVIVQALNEKSKYLLINGALTDEMMLQLLKKPFKDLTVVVESGAKCLFNEMTKTRFKRSLIQVKVLKKIDVIAVSYNPTSIYDYAFDEFEFKEALKKKINVPIYNVMGSECND